MIQPAFRCLIAAGVAVLLATSSGATFQSQPTQQPEQPQQRPVFRAGAHFVRVDAYPTADGRIVRGLTAEDFELVENGVAQVIESVQFVEFEPWNPIDERRDPSSISEMYRLAADPTYRVFVLYFDVGGERLDRPGEPDSTAIQDYYYLVPALKNMLSRMLGPRDLFGMLTPDQRPGDLTLGQKIPEFESVLRRRAALVARTDPIEMQLRACGVPQILRRYRLDKVFSDLEGLVVVLNAIREERKNIILFSNGWQLPGADASLVARRGPSGVPRIGVTRHGTLTTGATQPFEVTSKFCDEQIGYLANIDFYRRWRDLTLVARQKNVAFYTVMPGGVWAYDLMSDQTAYLLSLADETDGLYVAGTNDLQSGLRRVAEDLSAYYLLGYYTSNTDWDGRPRQIDVRLKSSGERIRARRQYVAPTEEEMALAVAAAEGNLAAAREPTAAERALEELGRLGSSAEIFLRAVADRHLTVVAELAAGQATTGRWRRGAEVTAELAAAGQSVGTASGRIEPGTRSVQLEIPVPAQTGTPWQVTLRVSAGDVLLTERVDFVAPASAAMGRPLVFRATPSPRSPLLPAADLLFRRTERVHLEWRVAGALSQVEGRLIGAGGEELGVPIALSERPDGSEVVLMADLILAPLAAADYVIEVSVTQGEQVQTVHQAIRVVR